VLVSKETYNRPKETYNRPKETYNRPKETYSYAKRDLQTHRQSGMRVFVGLLASRLYIPISIGLFSLITRPL